MNTVVVLQPQFFPWVGVFEQIRLADVYVHLDDVDFPQGRSFTSRVQIKTPAGSQWLTAPVVRASGQLIRDTRLDAAQPWRAKHLRTLQTSYSRAPFADEMLELVAELYALPTDSLCELNVAAIERIAAYFDFPCRFLRSSGRPTTSKSSQRLIDIVAAEEGDTYITGHGALGYLDYDAFEAAGIRVEYIDYRRQPYPQLHGGFDPHVSILDLIANVGRAGQKFICSTGVYWKEFVRRAA